MPLRNLQISDFAAIMLIKSAVKFEISSKVFTNMDQEDLAGQKRQDYWIAGSEMFSSFLRRLAKLEANVSFNPSAFFSTSSE